MRFQKPLCRRSVRFDRGNPLWEQEEAMSVNQGLLNDDVVRRWPHRDPNRYSLNQDAISLPSTANASSSAQKSMLWFLIRV